MPSRCGVLLCLGVVLIAAPLRVAVASKFEELDVSERVSDSLNEFEVGIEGEDALRGLHAVYGADEFEEGFDTASAGNIENVEADAASSMLPPVPLNFVAGSQESFYWEMYGIGAAILYLIVLVRGKWDNEARAAKWLDTVLPVLQQQFSAVGLGTDPGEEILIKTSHSNFLVWCSGRRNVDAAVFSLNLKNRQDLFTSFTSIFYPEVDTMCVELCVPEGVSIPDCVCAVVRRRDLDAMQEAHPDLKQFPSSLPSSSTAGGGGGALGLPKSAVVLCECADLASQLVKPIIKPLARAVESEVVQLRRLHLSDQNKQPIFGVETTPSRVLQLELVLGRGRLSEQQQQQQQQELSKLLEAVLFLADRVGGLKMGKEASARAKTRRRKQEQLAFSAKREEREEEMLRRKQEKLARERAEYQLLTAEGKARADARADKKLRKQMKDKRKAKVQMR